ncbi:OmpA family protein [Commensalibacter oyaizuii]|uniref:OmpA family protein n=1 Tax=Commensalibacter oyaizuii TaxID=3043873 RepID=A0ABT6PYF2_9PROT|nr:OmpA family protein [Commensalibacter sp. TBRC 16381]MDI2089887.1 OmpA family protein [Commensalibacter sp. TBRC 16381]
MIFSFILTSYLKRKKHLYLALTCTSLIALSPYTTNAQVSVNQSALNHLGPSTSKSHKKTDDHHKTNKQHSTKTKKTKDKSHTQAETPKKTAPEPKPQTPAVQATIPNAPPPVPVFKDADVTVPLHPPAPPPMPKVNEQAKGEVKTTDKRTILIFDKDSEELNEPMMKAIMDVANMLKQHPDDQIYLNAYSHGTSDDPSTPRRTALNRGLVIRAVLINQGIASTRIYLIAKGVPQTQDKNLNPDYVEMIRSDLLGKPTNK